jgi:hypothetical protein
MAGVADKMAFRTFDMPLHKLPAIGADKFPAVVQIFEREPQTMQFSVCSGFAIMRIIPG